MILFWPMHKMSMSSRGLNLVMMNCVCTFFLKFSAVIGGFWVTFVHVRARLM